jgi:hypothetical protein
LTNRFDKNPLRPTVKERLIAFPFYIFFSSDLSVYLLVILTANQTNANVVLEKNYSTANLQKEVDGSFPIEWKDDVEKAVNISVSA